MYVQYPMIKFCTKYFIKFRTKNLLYSLAIILYMIKPDFDRIIGSTETKRKLRKLQLIYIIIAVVMMLILYAAGQFNSNSTMVKYSESTQAKAYVPEYPVVTENSVYEGPSEISEDRAAYKVALQNVNVEDCYKITVESYKLRCKAIILLDQKTCEGIESDINKMNCFNAVAANVQEKNRCENLPGPVKPVSCNYRYDNII